MQPFSSAVYHQVLKFIEELERHHKDVSGGYELSELFRDRLRQMPHDDRKVVVEVLFHQFERGLRYGYMLPDVVVEVGTPEYIERLLKSTLNAVHLGIADYEEILSSIFENTTDSVLRVVESTSRGVISDMIGQGLLGGVVLLGVLVRLYIPTFVSEGAYYLRQWLHNYPDSYSTACIDTMLLLFSDLLHRDGIQSFLGMTRHLEASIPRETFIKVFQERIASNPLLSVSCKSLYHALGRSGASPMQERSE